MNEEDREMAEMEEWLAILRASADDDFRFHARPYFDDTGQLDVLWDNEGRIGVEEYVGRHRS